MKSPKTSKHKRAQKGFGWDFHGGSFTYHVSLRYLASIMPRLSKFSLMLSQCFSFLHPNDAYYESWTLLVPFVSNVETKEPPNDHGIGMYGIRCRFLSSLRVPMGSWTIKWDVIIMSYHHSWALVLLLWHCIFVIFGDEKPGSTLKGLPERSGQIESQGFW